MFSFSLKLDVETKDELESRIGELLWEIRHTWPVSLNKKSIDWIQEKTNISTLLIDHKGSKVQSLNVA